MSMHNIHTAHLIGNRHTKKGNTCDIEGGTIPPSFLNTVNMKAPVAAGRKAQLIPRILAHLMMVE
jgi:hypothetical protein